MTRPALRPLMRRAPDRAAGTELRHSGPNQPMPRARIPKRLERQRRQFDCRECPAHRAWVRRHHCSVPDCQLLPIECAHVRGGTDGGMALKPSDRWVISLCSYHHREQHQLGEDQFEARYGIELVDLAEEFARRSPHRKKLFARVDRSSTSYEWRSIEDVTI